MKSWRLLAIAALPSMVVGLPAAAKEIVIVVPGIPGPYCAYGLEKRLLELPGALSAATDWKRERIHLRLRDDARVTTADVKRAVKRADYPYDYKILAGGR